MMNEIMQRGPISCSIAVPASLEDYTYGIYYDQTGATREDHVISVVGWGEENGTKYWRIRNSWGSHWGEDGFFRLVRGVNNINIEGDCDWGTPLDTWTDGIKHITTEAEQNDPNNDKTIYPFPQTEYKPFSETLQNNFLNENGIGGCRKRTVNLQTNGVQKHARSWETVDIENLPVNVDWRNLDGRNWLSWNKN